MNDTEKSQAQLLHELHGLRRRIDSLSRQADEREQTEEALRISEEMFRQVFEDGPIGMHLIDPSLRILKVNAALCRMLTYAPEELPGRPLADIIHPDDVSAGLHLAQAMRAGKIPSYLIERRYLAKTGEVIWTNVQASIIRNDRGEPLYGIGVVENITERKRAEKERERLEQQLRQSQKMEVVGQLASGIAHDFNNILTTILGNVDFLRNSLQQDPNAPRHSSSALEEIHGAAERATALTRQLLTFSRRDIAQPTVLDLNEILTDFQPLLRGLIEEHITIETKLANDVPYIQADEVQIEQVLLNLALNARDAMPDGGRLAICTTKAPADVLGLAIDPSAPDAYAVITVSDNGIGMNDETLERIYEPFFTTKPAGRGTGLGLSTVYGIVIAAQGHIQVESQVGCGTTFHVFLPAARALKSAPGSRILQTVPRGSERVLVCEDEEHVRQVTCEALRASGYDVLEAHKAKRALELLASSTRAVDLLLTDLIMPGMNGRALANAVTRESPETRILFVSGYTSELLATQGIEHDRLDFLQKPFGVSELLRRVREVLDRAL